MNLCIFEDEGFRKLNPLCLARPTFDLRCGIETLLTKLRRILTDQPVYLAVRSYLADLTKRAHPESQVNVSLNDLASVLAINGRLLWNQGLQVRIETMPLHTAIVDGNNVLAIKIQGKLWDELNPLSSDFIDQVKDLSRIQVFEESFTTINYPWDLIAENGAQIEADFSYLTNDKPTLSGTLSGNVTCLNTERIHIGEGTVIKPGVVLDAERGPIYIGSKVRILPNAVLEGPLFIGANSLIKAGAKIYEDTSIGPVCKVGGEVEASILHAYSNKQHEGFLGHAYLGSWVNIGADSNNSDLKNNYSTVKMMIDGEWVDSGTQFLGLIMGDHSKCGINTTFNTGTVVGFHCNLYGSELHATHIPSFAWGSGQNYVTYQLEKAIEVATRVMGRREVNFDKIDRDVFTHIFNATADSRHAHNMMN